MESVPMTRRAAQAEEMLPLLKRHEIQVLLRAGHSHSDVAKRTGTSLDSVARVKREADVSSADDRAARRERQVGRPSKATPFAESVRGWLAKEPDASDAGAAPPRDGGGLRGPQECVLRARRGRASAARGADRSLRGPAGRVLAARLRPRRRRRSSTARKKRVHFFASRLKYSRFVAVTLVDNERVETIVRCLARDFVAFGGLPLMAVFDRPRTIVTKAGKGRDVREFNATFAQAIVDLGVGVEMCAPRSGNQKGSVERLVGWVKAAFFKHRKFQDDADLRAQLAAWHARGQHQDRVACDECDSGNAAARGARAPPAHQGVSGKARAAHPDLRRAHRRGDVRGRALLDAAEGDARRRHAVSLRAPPPHRRRTLRGAGIAEEARTSRRRLCPEHRAAKIAAVHGERAKLYEKRQQLLNLGPDALALLTELTHREPKLASRRVEELYDLLERTRRRRDARGARARGARRRARRSRRAARTLDLGRPKEGRWSSRHPGAAQPRGRDARQLDAAHRPRGATRGAS